jgi:electron transport complex protein RnfB
MPIIIPVAVLSGIGFVMAALLAVGRKAFYVEVDERIELIADILPGANCGGCGFPGCSGYATALIEKGASPTSCPPGGAELANEIGGILGVEVGDMPDLVALVACAGDNDLAPKRAEYIGVQTCAGVHAVSGGIKKCAHGCLGFGSCNDVCPFGAIVMTDNGMAVVVPELCTGCGKCVDACPRQIISLVSKNEKVHVLCRNPGKAKAVKAVCSVGCTGCKICNKQSPRFAMDGSLAVLDPAAEGDIPANAPLACPQGAIYDGRVFNITSWITDPACRTEHDARSEEWQKAEKDRKMAAKKAKAAKKAAAEKAAEEQAGEKKGEAQ